jgi:ATP/maltotriose-dependent transcriptional regulator MalT
VLASQGALDEARALTEEAVYGFVLQRSAFFEGAARQSLAQILLLVGRIDDAEREVWRALDVAERLPTLRAVALAILAQVRLARGDAEEGLRAAGEALQLISRLGGVEEGEALVRAVFVEALVARGDEAAAASAAIAAKERLCVRGASIADPSFRHRFFEVVPEHARTLALWRRLAEDL